MSPFAFVLHFFVLVLGSSMVNAAISPGGLKEQIQHFWRIFGSLLAGALVLGFLVYLVSL
jgi:hypothetical protein